MAYLATMIFEMALMTVGVLALLMVIPLAERADQLGADAAQALGSLAVEASETAYRSASSRSDRMPLPVCAAVRPGLVPR